MLPIVVGYLAGSVPFAFLLARRAGVDVRIEGSRNVGATNVFRTAGIRLGVLVMALDVGKGAAAVGFAQLTSASPVVPAAAGAAAVVGHVYPLWLRFHGGKGVAVAAGVFWVLTPLATTIAAVLFAAIVATTRYVSLGSVTATLALLPMAWLTGAPRAVLAAAIGSAALILFRHRENMRRLYAGTERRLRRRPADAR